MTGRAARGALLAGLCLLTPAPIPGELAVGETITVAVTVRGAETRPLPGVAVSWTPSTGRTVDPAATTRSGP